MPFFLRVSTGAARISVSFFSWHARVCALMMVEQGRSTYHCRTPCCHTGEIRGVKIRRVHHVGVIHGWACQEAKEPRTKWRGGLDDCICQEAECAGRRHVWKGMKKLISYPYCQHVSVASTNSVAASNRQPDDKLDSGHGMLERSKQEWASQKQV